MSPGRSSAAALSRRPAKDASPRPSAHSTPRSLFLARQPSCWDERACAFPARFSNAGGGRGAAACIEDVPKPVDNGATARLDALRGGHPGNADWLASIPPLTPDNVGAAALSHRIPGIAATRAVTKFGQPGVTEA